MQTIECVICCENINKRRTEITCLYCDKKCCRSCFGIRLLSTDSDCMFCRRDIPDDFIDENMTKIFNVSYREHRYEQNFTREKSLLPETQERAERERDARVLENDFAVINMTLGPIHDKLIHYKKHQLFLKQEIKIFKEDKKVIKLLKNEMKEERIEIKTQRYKRDDILKQIRSISVRIENLRRPPRERRAVEVAVEVAVEEKKYTRPCPDSECRGYLSSAYKCGTCVKYFCSDCHVVKGCRDDKEHICNEDIKASIKMINLDSKACPKCYIHIYRTEGCSLMWCIQCHTQFDWNTLKIKHGYNHNPEYFRYLRSTGNNVPRNPHDIPVNCNIMPDYFQILQSLGRINIPNVAWDEIYRHRLHIMDVMTHLPRRVEMIDCSDLRVKYLLLDYNEEKWKKIYFQRMKKNEINHERYKVLDMYCNVIKDNFLNLMTETSLETFMTFKHSCERIEEYADEQLLKINKKYNSKNMSYLKVRSV